MNSKPFGKSLISSALGYCSFDTKISLRYNFLIFAAALIINSFSSLFSSCFQSQKSWRETTMALIEVGKIIISSLQLYFEVLRSVMLFVKFRNLRSYFHDCVEFAVTLFFQPMVQHSKDIKYSTMKWSSSLLCFVFWNAVTFCYTYFTISCHICNMSFKYNEF